MSQPQHDRPEPYSRPPHRKADPKPGRGTLIGVALGAGLIAGWLIVSPGSPPEAPAPGEAPAPPAAPLDAAARFRACRPYEQYAADIRSPSVSDAQLIEEAACLCSLAKGFNVLVKNGGLTVYAPQSACPAGSTPMPLEPDAKQWKGDWIDEPGHTACFCTTNPRDLNAIVDRR